MERRELSAARRDQHCDQRFALEPLLKTSTTTERNSAPPDSTALREAVLKVAILGTARQALDTEKLGAGATDSLSQLLAQLDFSDRENSVLAAAALLFQYERAGQIPSAADATRPQPCPVDEMPRCNAAASVRLAGLLQQTQSPLLAEWLRVAAERELRAPEEHLPALLDAGKQHRELRPLIVEVLGNRGRWLAAHNPAWSYAVEAWPEQMQSDELWQTGSKAERLSFLQYWREHDAAKARELLASTWTQEPPEDRAQFIAAFQISLSAADEEFLESALDDKRKEVRQTAAELLAQLPESRLVARNFERLKNVLAFTATSKLKKLAGRGAVIEASLPQEFDTAMARDGIEEKRFGGKQGQKANWVQQMLGLVPPSFWEREWNLSPREIVQAANAGEWSEVLLAGFARAAVRHRATSWLEVLGEEALGARSTLDAGIIAHLPGATLERLVMARFKSGLLKTSDRLELRNALAYHRTAWSDEFTRFVLNAARTERGQAGTRNDWLHYALSDWAFWIPPDLYGEAATGWPSETRQWPQWEPTVNEFLQILETRREMRRELHESQHH
jgi:hypothetical protein